MDPGGALPAPRECDDWHNSIAMMFANNLLWPQKWWQWLQHFSQQAAPLTSWPGLRQGHSGVGYRDDIHLRIVRYIVCKAGVLPPAWQCDSNI